MILSHLQPLLACATCMGDASDHATRAAGVSIFFLLLVMLCVAGGCVRFFLFLAKCERRATVPVRARRTDPASPASRRAHELTVERPDIT